MDGGETFYGFEFNNDSTLNKQIDPVAALELDIFIDNRHWLLALHVKVSKSKLF